MPMALNNERVVRLVSCFVPEEEIIRRIQMNPVMHTFRMTMKVQIELGKVLSPKIIGAMMRSYLDRLRQLPPPRRPAFLPPPVCSQDCESKLPAPVERRAGSFLL